MKNRILKALAHMNGLALVLAGCALDMKNNTVPLIVIAVTGAWLMLFAYANRYTNISKEAAHENH